MAFARADLFAAAFLGLVLATNVVRSRKWRSLAPGPIRWPLLGNALQIPQDEAWLTLSEWAKIYGDIMHLDVLGQPMIILSSVKAAKDLMDKRSLIYSNRPHLVMAGELSGFKHLLTLQPYGEEWRKQRKMVAQEFSPSMIHRYHRLQEVEAVKLVRDALSDPSSLERQVQLKIGAVIMRATYGYNVESFDDVFLTTALAAIKHFSYAAAPGAWLVDVLPQLQYLPSWFPGTGFLKTAAAWRNNFMDMAHHPYAWAKERWKSGTARTPNLCATVLSENENFSSEDEDRLMFAATTMFGGGTDTNMSSIMTFFMAMLRHPDIQAKARAEIDSVVGPDRLPTIADRTSLPYVRSIMTEVFRWQPAVPLGIPHSLTQDDVYEGVFLPKDSLIVPNVWHMLHDPAVYPDPLAFDPSRYAGSDTRMRAVTDLAFGFGRRACPGFHFAEGTAFAIIATVLATCDIVPVKDALGRDIIPEPQYTSGAIVLPKPFPCDLKCRSPQALALLSQEPLQLD